MFPIRSHSEPAPTVSTMYAEASTELMIESSFATKVADIDGPTYARVATLERSGQSRNENPVQAEGSASTSAEIMNRPKMPQYPGLERWILVERIGDGAFSNVYRAQDSTMEYADVAIKVLKLSRMDDNQVALPTPLPLLNLPFLVLSGSCAIRQLNMLTLIIKLLSALQLEKGRKGSGSSRNY